jgi:hypothetical protein
MTYTYNTKDHSIDFMTFWDMCNRINKSHGKPELGWADARDYWDEVIARKYHNQIASAKSA